MEIVSLTLSQKEDKSAELQVVTHSVTEGEFLDFAYKKLVCDTIQSIYCTFNGKKVAIYFDEEGLYRDHNYGFHLIEETGKEWQLLGGLVITGMPDSEGDLMSSPLTEDEIRDLLRPLPFPWPGITPLRVEKREPETLH